uniref:Early flowering 4 n=1 Tax=Dimocarpus longan TaxID=128017 RepID=A0A059V8X7_9ROSI|nr:early flowering 4 [Dimocarpus longan]AHZ89708.1 early flowering 4 [Dimocarpus longan]
MTPAPLDSSSSSEAESTTITTMDNLSNTTTTAATNRNNKHRRSSKSSHTLEDQDAGGDPQVWMSLNCGFKEVQSVLDRNRVLIQQVNENHQSRIPDNMVKNVALIQEINGNISKVVSLYSDMSSDFSSAFHQENKHADDD